MNVTTKLAAVSGVVVIAVCGAVAHAAPVEQVPWSVPSDLVVERREITVENQDARLAGTLSCQAASSLAPRS